MTIEEAISHIEYSIKAYQNLIENDIRSGEAIGKDIKGEWKSEKTLADAYMKMIESLKMAIKALEQEPILDKIIDDIQTLRGCSCNNSDGIIDDVEDIIDKYKAESEDKE